MNSKTIYQINYLKQTYYNSFIWRNNEPWNWHLKPHDWKIEQKIIIKIN